MFYLDNDLENICILQFHFRKIPHDLCNWLQICVLLSHVFMCEGNVS